MAFCKHKYVTRNPKTGEPECDECGEVLGSNIVQESFVQSCAKLPCREVPDGMYDKYMSTIKSSLAMLQQDHPANEALASRMVQRLLYHSNIGNVKRILTNKSNVLIAGILKLVLEQNQVGARDLNLLSGLEMNVKKGIDGSKFIRQACGCVQSRRKLGSVIPMPLEEHDMNQKQCHLHGNTSMKIFDRIMFYMNGINEQFDYILDKHMFSLIQEMLFHQVNGSMELRHCINQPPDTLAYALFSIYTGVTPTTIQERLKNQKNKIVIQNCIDDLYDKDAFFQEWKFIVDTISF